MTLSVLLTLAACESTSMIEGKVVDIWGNPIEGATVMVVGGTERPLTDADGRYKIARTEGALQIKAGRKGYVQDHRELAVKPGETPAGPVFELYPKPEKPGFYLVATGRYQPVPQRRVEAVGNALKTYRGVEDPGDAETESASPRIVFHTELRADEITRLGLELHRLTYVEEAELQGPVGRTTATVNLYVDDGEIPLEIEPLRSRTDYLVTPKEPLEPGVYALQAQDLLSADDLDRFEEIPDELRIVFPFQVR